MIPTIGVQLGPISSTVAEAEPRHQKRAPSQLEGSYNAIQIYSRGSIDPVSRKLCAPLTVVGGLFDLAAIVCARHSTVVLSITIPEATGMM